MSEEVVPPQPTEQPKAVLKKTITSTRQKVTLSLTDLANGKSLETPEKNSSEVEVKPSTLKKENVFSIEELKQAWDEFTEQRKSQVGEYHLLRQEFDYKDNVITIHLSNQVEEPLLQSIRTPLTEFLRSRLGNDSINVISQVTEVHSKKIAYTNKEKFDHLAEKNPILIELKERLGLDPDY